MAKSGEVMSAVQQKRQSDGSPGQGGQSRGRRRGRQLLRALSAEPLEL